jgi:hypothetical protein
MKSTIITLGIAALSFNFSNAANACKEQYANQQEVSVISTDSTQQMFTTGVKQNNSTVGVDNTTDESLVFNPTAVIKASYAKSIEEVVSENKLITDSHEEAIQPLSIEKTAIDYIKEANQIIEGNPNQEVYPLDFEAINQAIKNEKESHVSLTVSSDLKL